MANLFGILAAGAAQGYGNAKNAEVNLHNQQAIENNREAVRQQYENYRFERGLQAGMQQAEMKAKHDAAMYQRDRSDKLQDKDADRKFELEKMGIQHKNARSIEGMRETGRNSRALLRRDSPTSGEEFSSKELIKQIESNNKRIFDLKKELNSNPFASNDPKKGQLYQSEINRLETDNANKQRMLGVEPEQSPQQAAFDFVFNPQTGRLEPAQ